MPLHLLGKKSWNVYNPANIERVRRDEADAAAREAAEEQRMQEVDAERRMRILRGLPVDDLDHRDGNGGDHSGKSRGEEREGGRVRQPDRNGPPPPPSSSSSHSFQRDRKRRRLAGEDDTDKEIRWAREDQEMLAEASAAAREESIRAAARERQRHRPGEGAEVTLTDSRGRMNFFVDREREDREKEKEAAAGARKRKDRRDRDDPPTAGEGAMRFADAAGFDKTPGSAPWYYSAPSSAAAAAATLRSEDVGVATRMIGGGGGGGGKDAFGNPDPGRHARDVSRTAAEDPLAAMRRGVHGVREVERERKRWNEEREKEKRELMRDDLSIVAETANEEKKSRYHKSSSGRMRRSSSRREVVEETRWHREKRRDEASRHWDADGKDDPDSDSLNGFSLDAPEREPRDHSHRSSDFRRHKSTDERSTRRGSRSPDDRDRRHRHRHRHHRHRHRDHDSSLQTAR